jgi:hypothetical protein
VPPPVDEHRPVTTLFLDSETQMLYNINEPKWENSKEFMEQYPEKEKNLFNFKPKKIIFNDNIKHGHWFKLPPGWSLIDVSPLVDEALWGGKRWLDARPFDWGYSGNEAETVKRRDYFNSIYYAAATKYLSKVWPTQIFAQYENEPLLGPEPQPNRAGYIGLETEEERLAWLRSFELVDLEPYL